MSTQYQLVLVPAFEKRSGLGLAHILADYGNKDSLCFEVFDFNGKYSDFANSTQFSNEEKTKPFFIEYFRLAIFKDEIVPIISNFNFNDLEIVIENIRKIKPSINILLVTYQSQTCNQISFKNVDISNHSGVPSGEIFLRLGILTED
jgi:hypothetical protein